MQETVSQDINLCVAKTYNLTQREES